MNEQGIAFVNWMLSLICAVLFWYAARTNDWTSMILAMVFAGIIAVLSALVLVCRYL